MRLRRLDCKAAILAFCYRLPCSAALSLARLRGFVSGSFGPGQRTASAFHRLKAPKDPGVRRNRRMRAGAICLTSAYERKRRTQQSQSLIAFEDSLRCLIRILNIGSM